VKIQQFRAVAAAALAVMAGAVIAQAPPEPAGWPQALDAAWQRALEAAERGGQLQRALAERDAADQPWAAPPAIEFDHRTGRSPGNGSASETEIGLVWPLWLPAQRQSRVGAADADIAAARQGLEAARWRLAGELRQVALSVAAQQAELREAEVQVRLLRTLAEDVERRVQAGDLARADTMAARAELLQAEVQQQDSAQRLQQARERWQLLTGASAIPPVPAAPGAAPQGDHPELAAASANVERARRRLALAERSRRDPPEAGVRLRRETDGSGSASSVGVSLRVPFASGPSNLSSLAQARSDLDLALAEEQRARDRVALEAASARQQVASATRQLEAERARAGLLRQRAQLIDASFRAGETALPELLRALGAANQAEAAVVRQQSALQQAQGRLSQSLGVMP
jgi:cobalt-zinc-cadmium efflux system outer membrane protein